MKVCGEYSRFDQNYGSDDVGKTRKGKTRQDKTRQE